MNFLDPDNRARFEDGYLRGLRLRLIKSFAGPAGLLAFVRHFWSVLEPQTRFVDGWPLHAICDHLQAVSDGKIHRLLINVPPGFMKSLLVDVFWPAWEWATISSHFRYVTFSYSSSLTERDNRRFGALVTCPEYQELFGDKVKIVKLGDRMVSNTGTGWKLASSVGGVGTGERGDRVILDDPHNVKEAESEIIRTETVRWFRESMSNRLNDMDAGAIVVIMQRLHGDDVSGVILEQGMAYTHLMIPMEYDYDRQTDENYDPITSPIGWYDPRYDAYEVDDPTPLLAWPERFPERVVDAIKVDMGPYACTPRESPILMADLSYKPIGEIEIGDHVVGFTTDTQGGKKRKVTIPTTIKAIHRYRAPVVRITLSSGEVIRCTEDHRWYMGKQAGFSGSLNKAGERHMKPLYRPAKVGRRLMRVSNLQDTDCYPEDERDAGWLAGFFDGDGSVSNAKKTGTDFKPSATIAFYQGSGRNLPNCDRLEECLAKFGFKWSIDADRRKGFDYRAYRLIGNDLPLYQKFLHVVQPTKWRDRILTAAYGTKFIIGEETVVSIEPDGVEEVFALETGTSNYVVWGLASSNSAGQYQQSPTPRGGGIFKRDWWQVWDRPDGKFPEFSYIIASVDSAFTGNERNDPTALTVWGVFKTSDEKSRLMLVHAWRKHLPFSGVRNDPRPGESRLDYVQRTNANWGLVEWIKYSCERCKVDNLLIEAKASGMSAAQELSNRYGRLNFGVQLMPVKGDKEARALAAQPTFSQLLVYAPVRDWSGLVIDEMEAFPKHKYDDLTDSTTQAIKYVRDNDLLNDDSEMEARERDAAVYRNPKSNMSFW